MAYTSFSTYRLVSSLIETYFVVRDNLIVYTQDHFLYLSIQDPQSPPRAGFNEEKSISVWTNGGRMKVSCYMFARMLNQAR